MIGGVDVWGSEKQNCSLEAPRIHLLGGRGHKCGEYLMGPRPPTTMISTN